jgi:hypothetical protein
MPKKNLRPSKIIHQTLDLLDHRAASLVRTSIESSEIASTEGRFDRAVMDYYQSKSVEADHGSFEAIAENALHSENLAQKILSMPATSARQVLTKLSVLDAELLSDLDCEAPVERRHIVAFATLKVDIVRLLAQTEK